MTTVFDIAPFIPSEAALEKSLLPDKVMALSTRSAELAGGLAPESFEVIRRHMAVINSYYSNLIEGNSTRPHDIRRAQAGDYSDDPFRRDLQKESVAHIEVQEWLFNESPNLDRIFSHDFLLELHRQFYGALPDSLKLVHDETNNAQERVIPGTWRSRDVSIGSHVPPSSKDLCQLVKRFCETYHPNRYHGTQKVIAVLSAHHRFLWIHPFLDGNGRVARLWTDAALRAIGLTSYGLWSISRGLARTSDQYKKALAQADFPRQGNIDGRGALSESGLMNFCDYMLETALDQVNYMSEMLDLKALKKRVQAYVTARNHGLISGFDAPLKHTATTVIFNAFISGELDRKEALELTAMPERSGRRILSQLREDGLLTETGPRSPLRWAIPEHAEPWYFPELVK
ncbi:Fic family protein [Marinobacter fonticola]|uniref:Fic family protein n=1 Tax=Marinobacter fonticola TaxID=2603215 RepID=UPI0011E63057|nr:Fic family protein [Marinobacter fonticola]